MTARAAPIDASAARRDLEALLGWRVAGSAFAEPERRRLSDLDGWPLEALSFAAEDGEPIPALFLRPPDGAPPAPAVLYLHAHGNRYETGCAELVDGRPALVGPYAPDLRRRGIAALAVEAPSFGARRTPDEATRAKAHLWRGRTLFGQMLAEFSAAIGWLARQPTVQGDRIGALGFSMGATCAYWLAALDPRVACAASLCAFADLETLVRSGAHAGHGVYMTVPGLLQSWSTGRIAALAAPRPLFIGAGMRDWSTPPDAFDRARAELERGYAEAGAAEALRFHVERRAGHVETPAMRAATLAFLEAASPRSNLPAAQGSVDEKREIHVGQRSGL